MEVVDRDEAIMYVISGLNIPLKLNAATLIPGLHCPYHWAGKLGAQPAEGLVTHADDELYEKRGEYTRSSVKCARVRSPGTRREENSI